MSSEKYSCWTTRYLARNTIIELSDSVHAVWIKPQVLPPASRDTIRVIAKETLSDSLIGVSRWSRQTNHPLPRLSDALDWLANTLRSIVRFLSCSSKTIFWIRLFVRLQSILLSMCVINFTHVHTRTNIHFLSYSVSFEKLNYYFTFAVADEK